MNQSEFITQYTKPVIAAIKSKYVVYALHTNDEENSGEQVTDAMDALGTLCARASENFIQHTVDVTQEGYRYYTKSPSLPQTEYFCFAPHINVGYSPFIFYKDKDGQLQGLFVKLRQHRFTFCSKTIKKLVQRHYEAMFKEDMPISMRDAKAHIKDRLEKGNQDDVPVLEKTHDVTFYLNLTNATVLAKSAHRDQDGLAAFFILMQNLVERDQERKNKIPGAEALISRALSNRLFTTAYANHAMSVAKAFGAYSLSNMVDFYAAQDDDKTAEPCAVEPTWSAGFTSKDNASQTITFKNSIGLFLPNVDLDNPPPTTFTMINQFAETKSLNINSLRVIGELPIGKLLTEYRETYHESLSDEDDVLNGDFLDILFNTQSKDGNICLQISDPLRLHKEAIRVFLRDHLHNNSCSNKALEKVMLERNGDLLGVLHDAGELFVTLYLDSNPLVEEFGQDDAIERALKAG